MKEGNFETATYLYVGGKHWVKDLPDSYIIKTQTMEPITVIAHTLDGPALKYNFTTENWEKIQEP